MKNPKRHLCRRWLPLLLILSLLLALIPLSALATDGANLLTNGDFETADYSGWTVNVVSGSTWGSWEVKTDSWDTNNTTNFLQLSNYTGTDNLTAEATQTIALEAGTYTATIQSAGANEGASSSDLVLSAVADGTILDSSAIALNGWSQWATTTITFTLDSAADVTVGVTGTLANSSYCDLDNATLTASTGAGSEKEPVDLPLENGNFETGDSTHWALSGFSSVAADAWAVNNTTNTLNLWLSDSEAMAGSAAYTVTLTAGTYQFGFDLSGAESNSGLSYFVTAGGTTLVSGSETYTTTGWDAWATYTTSEFTLAEETEVTFTLSGTVPAAYWGNLDNLTLKGTGSIVEEDTPPVTAPIDVEKVSGLSDDFIMGMDISSVISEFNSGVTYQDFDGNEIDNVTDFCEFLATCGVTHVRVRVWNDPYDASGNGYGGGNNGIDTAVEIAEGCAAAGLKMLVDFHCSDFWCDPGKQPAPKAWAGYTLAEKSAALQSFLTDSLTKIKATGAEIAMVQVGNETTGGFIGEKSVANMCALFSAGSAAIRDFDENIKVVIHVTNPEKSTMTAWAKNLSDNSVDYDILATSYYSVWHGTLENLKSQLKAVQDTYGKDVMVAETSYAFTMDETDGHVNTVREDASGLNLSYAVTPQGQADCIRDIIAAVSEAGGLGVFYWEPAWITVGDTTGLEGDAYNAQVAANRALWEQYGSGWASSYAADYDPDDAGVWYGGSAVDNQAMFDADGAPLASINVWNYVKTGAVSNTVSVETIADAGETIEAGSKYTLPETVTVTYNKGVKEEAVKWDTDDVNAIDSDTVGTYVVHGTVTLAPDFEGAEYAGDATASVTYTLTVIYPNLITDDDDASFEKGDNFTISGSGINLPAADDPKEGSYSMHWWSETAAAGTVTYDEIITLQPGFYAFEAAAQGYAGDTVTLKILDTAGNVLFSGNPTALTGWADWQTPSVNFVVTEETQVKLQIAVDIQAAGWGTVDCLYLHSADDLKILYTNDVHTYINKDLTYSLVAAYRDSLDNVLLVDAGDHIQGTAYGGMDSGKTIIDIMNAARYDIATLGNHEFDYGMEGCMNAIAWADFPYVSCNFYHEADGVVGDSVLDSYRILEVSGLKIAFIGITTPESFTKSTPAYFQDADGNYIYGIAGGSDGSALYAAVQKAIDAASAEADIVIALGHLGDDPSSQPWTSLDVIANTTGLDAFIDGHSHSTVPYQEVTDKGGSTVVLTQTGSYLDALGQMTISADGSIKTELLTADDLAGITPDARVKAIESAWIAEVDALLGEKIADTEIEFTISDADGNRAVRTYETNLGDFNADAYYWYSNEVAGLDCDIAIMNGGGIRATAAPGDWSYLTCKTINTFGNVLCVVKVSGQSILDALEFGARFVGEGENGGFLQVAGLTYEINTAIPNTVKTDDKSVWLEGPDEYRVTNVQVYNKATGEYEPLDLNKIYTMAGTNYTLLNCGDGFNMFGEAEKVLDGTSEDYLALAAYAMAFADSDGDGYAELSTENSPLASYAGYLMNYEDPTGASRITVVNRAPVDPKDPEAPTTPETEPTNPNETTDSETPRTGDDGIVILLAAMLVSCCGIVGTLAYKRKHF